MTAVEWLGLYIKGITSLNCDEIIEQAKEMEKEQIMTAFMKNLSIEYGVINAVQKAEQYYNETYGGEK